MQTTKQAIPRLRGQAAVEFALIFGVLMALIYGTLEVSRLMFINAELDNAAKEGARYASLSPGVTDYSLRNVIASKLVLTNISDVTINSPTYSPVAGQRCTYCRVTVTLSYPWQTGISFLNLGPITLQSSATTLIEISGN
jgi:Flp pilus assembly protein TadG